MFCQGSQNRVGNRVHSQYAIQKCLREAACNLQSFRLKAGPDEPIFALELECPSSVRATRLQRPCLPPFRTSEV
jgi:hypothetical protein